MIVPSIDALITALPLGVNDTAVTAAVCSENVTKQNPEDTFHIFTYMVVKSCDHHMAPYFAVISSCGYQLTIRAVAHDIHVIEMTLLLQDVRLRLPFPYQELP